MPLYEYRCQSCNEVLEVLQKVSDRARRKCPSCAGRLEKMVSPSGFRLKGTGWYVTDYGKGGSSGKGDGDSEGGGKKSDGDSEGGGKKSEGSDGPTESPKPDGDGKKGKPAKKEKVASPRKD